MSLKNTIVYDGNCGFCKRWLKRLDSQFSSDIYKIPFQDLEGTVSKEQLSEFKKAMYFYDQNGNPHGGAAAFFKAMSDSGNKKWLWGVYNLPLGKYPFEWVYKVVAKNRRHL